jgi:hypothetical protein
MSFPDKKIDDLFKALEQESVSPDAMQFEDMDIRLDKMRYYKFGWKHFNIYHTCIMALCCTISVGLLANYLNDKLSASPQQRTEILTDTLIENRVTQPGETTTTLPDNKKTLQNKGLKAFKVLALDSVQIQPTDSALHKEPIIQPLITEASHSKKADSLLPVTKVAKVKKIIYVNKRDTIVKYDTTRVFKKK